MPQSRGPVPRRDGGRRLIWAREDVVVTSSQDPETGRPIHYVKVNDTGEIFEFGEEDYQIWKQFAGGASLEEAERALGMQFGPEFHENLRDFVADLAARGLLQGAIPLDLARRSSRNRGASRMRFHIDPDGNDRKPPYWSRFQFVIFNPNALFGRLAQHLRFLSHFRWPIAIATFIAILTLVKHLGEYGADFSATRAQWSKIPYNAFTLVTINLTRVVAQGAVARHYGAQVRYFSMDFIFGFWPRFYVDQSGMRRLERRPQLWGHSTPFFVRLAYFSGGTIGWAWYLKNGSYLSQIFLLLSEAAVIDLVASTLPIFRSETYYWLCAYFWDPFLRDRSLDALRSVFLGKAAPHQMPPAERTALVLYGLSWVASVGVVIYVVVTFFTGITTYYHGAGFAIFAGLVGIVTWWALTLRRFSKQMQARRSETRALRLSRARGAAASARSAAATRDEPRRPAR